MMSNHVYECGTAVSMTGAPDGMGSDSFARLVDDQRATTR
jgi:hypothetical protein